MSLAYASGQCGYFQTNLANALVETTILVDYLRGSDAAAEYLDKARAEGDLLCSTVTLAELIVGCRTRGEIREIDQLLARFQNEPITSSDSTRAPHLAAEDITIHVEWDFTTACSAPRPWAGKSLSPR